MKRRTFVQKSSLVSLGVLAGSFLSAAAEPAVALSRAEQAMIADFERQFAATQTIESRQCVKARLMATPVQRLPAPLGELKFRNAYGAELSLSYHRGALRIMNC